MKVLVCLPNLTEKDRQRLTDIVGNAELIFSSSREEVATVIDQVEVGLGFVPVSLLARAEQMKWLQVAYAGVEKVLTAPWANPQMVLTNGSGVFGINMAENVLGMLLAFTRGLHIARDYQHAHQWKWDYHFGELYRSTVGLLGYGNIGVEVAKRLAPFETRNIVIRRTPRGSEEGAFRVVSLAQVDSVLGELDFLICSLPHTSETVGLFDYDRLSRLPNRAVVINVGRGSLFVEGDLIRALKEGIIAGAGLDVTAQEPLPPDSELWDLPNVILTPHVSGRTPQHTERILDIFEQNWQRFLAGRPLKNVVRRELGY